MWGYLAGSGGARASIYPEMVLQRLMDNEFGKGVVKMSTLAVSGTMASQLATGTDGRNAAWPKPVNAHIVVLNYGINELRNNVPVATYRATLDALSTAPVPTKVVFQTPFPVYGSTPPSQVYADAMRDVARKHNLMVIDAMAYLLGLPSWQTQYATDGFHATSAGYELVGTNVQYPVLSKMAKAFLCK
jgi:lysophospholipase L1-like esterase